MSAIYQSNVPNATEKKNLERNFIPLFYNLKKPHGVKESEREVASKQKNSTGDQL